MIVLYGLRLCYKTIKLKKLNKFIKKYICFYNIFKAATSNPNGLLSQKLCHYLDQGHTLNDMLLRAAHGTAYFDPSKLNLAEANILKVLESQLHW